jgi:anti-sigma factor RsiW
VHRHHHDDDRLSAFLDDELDERTALSVAHHLDGCDDCRAELETLRATRAALRAMPPVEPPLSFMVEQVVLGPAVADEGPSTLAIGALVAASVVLVTAFALGADRGDVTPDVDMLVVDHVETVGGGPVVVPVTLDR